MITETALFYIYYGVDFMELNIGENIRHLRRERDMTQERLAELLGVTCAAVSKWERCESCPDIGMVIPLARVFGVSTDELMGYNAEKTAAEVKKIISEYNKLHAYGKYDEANKLILDARKTYPNDYEIMCHYMWVLSGGKWTVKVEKLNENCEELYKICDAILSGCTVERIRLEAISMKAKLEQAAGRTDTAKNIISEFPKLHRAAEIQLAELFPRGTAEYLLYTKNSLYQLAQHLGFSLVRSVWFDDSMDSSERVRRIEAFGDAFADMSERFGEITFYIIEWAVFSHLKLQLITAGGRFDDILRIAEKEFTTLVKTQSTAKDDEVLGKDALGMLQAEIKRHKTSQAKAYAELRTHPEFMALLEKYS